MITRKVFYNFRSQLIIVLGITVFFVLGFSFYIFLKTTVLSNLLIQPEALSVHQVSIEQELDAVRHASFLLIIAILVITLGLLIHLVISLSYSLRHILRGIHAMEEGRLEYHIPLISQDEFGQIAHFLNRASERLLSTQRQLVDSKNSIEQEVYRRTMELQAERNKLSLIFGVIADAIIVTDVQKHVIFINRAAQQLLGQSNEAILSKPIHEVITLYEKEKKVADTLYYPPFREYYEGIVFDKKGLTLTRNDGKKFFVDVKSGQIKEGSNVNIGTILMLHDVTSERVLEEMKLDFVSMAAHELRTPLTTINGYLSVFIEENARKLNNDQKLFLNRITIATHQLVALVESLLNVSRIERGALTVTVQPIAWMPFVKQMVTEFEERVRQKQLTLTIKEPTVSIPMVKADVLRIGEVFSNLLSNAITYTTNGGTITIRVEVANREVITHIQDTGEGIPPEAIPRLFTKFFRVSGKLEQGSKGTGLGLYISKEIISLHNGRIWVKSTFGEGSTFSFALPVAG